VVLVSTSKAKINDCNLKPHLYMFVEALYTLLWILSTGFCSFCVYMLVFKFKLIPLDHHEERQS